MFTISHINDICNKSFICDLLRIIRASRQPQRSDIKPKAQMHNFEIEAHFLNLLIKHNLIKKIVIPLGFYYNPKRHGHLKFELKGKQDERKHGAGFNHSKNQSNVYL